MRYMNFSFRIKNSFAIVVFTIFITTICVSCMDIKYDALPFDGKVLPRRSGYVNRVTNDWIYFNLRTGDIFNADRVESDIKEGEQLSRYDWDLAFCGYTLRTNSGTSGPGLGGVIDLGYGGYDELKFVSQLPSSPKWILDTDDIFITMAERDWVHYCIVNNLKNIPWFDPNKGPKRTKTTANRLLEDALRFVGPPHSYIPSFHTYVVRTSDGMHYFKLQIISWFDTSVDIGDTGGRISYYCDELLLK